MKPIQRLKQQYKISKQYTPNSRDRKDRELSYLAMRLFCLDCDLLTFQEVEQMEYEVDNELKNLVE